jgi:hypothetical protein
MMVILSALMLGAVSAEVFDPTEETPAQEIARASRKWCPPSKKPDKQWYVPMAS